VSPRAGPTGDVRLRDVAEDDLPILFEHQREAEANRMAAFPARDWKAFVAHWTGILADDSVIKTTVLVDGKVAGNIVSFERDGRREVGYWIGRRYWGKGIATGALAAFLGQVSTRPLYARVATHNVGSIRVLEKCGFTEDGRATSPGDDIEEAIMKLPAPGQPGLNREAG
jgi:RimJ/RimL family protein N-acetyltransferase